MDVGDDKWVDRDSGPVVRPYALTGGRTEPVTGVMLDLIAIVVAAPRGAGGDLTGLGPEYRKILALCGQPAAVADVASDTGLPLGVVRVLLADLVVQGRLTVMRQQRGDRPSADLLEEVLHGLRAL